ncbi:guanine nucleotide-binding protein subunit alpha [Termitomyces sp. Mn162]|nr:guanine nucleotide-binding protein subunit alpha [Termitomyces sp. Mn162]
MGGCLSTPDRAGKERSDAIDKQLEDDNKKFKKECKILLLGSGESGKSTIVKQMKIIHQGGYRTPELMEVRPTIYKNVLDSAQAVVTYMRKLGLDCAELPNRILADRILAYRFDSQDEFDPAVASAIHQVWKDPVVPKVMDEHSSDFYLMDSAS